MGIDGIGKGGGVPPTTHGVGDVGASKPASEVTESGRVFEVRGEKTQAATKTNAADHVEKTPLEKLRAGEVDVHGYVDLKVEAATRNLKGLGPVELDHIRASLKHQMANDPAISDLVKQVAGSTPKTDDE
jgi:hypothetical protein